MSSLDDLIAASISRLGFALPAEPIKPVPPSNVRLVRDDGTEIPLELRYAGRQLRTGRHLWMATVPVWLGDDSKPDIVADDIPPGAAIGVTLRGVVCDHDHGPH